MYSKKTLALLVGLVVAGTAGSTLAAPKDGTYQESVMGHNAKFNVAVTFENGKMT